MPPGAGSGLLYKDQATAENMADHHRQERRRMLDELSILNTGIDSASLARFIDKEERSLRP